MYPSDSILQSAKETGQEGTWALIGQTTKNGGMYLILVVMNHFVMKQEHRASLVAGALNV